MFIEKNKKLIDELYQVSNPIIRYKIEKELFNKTNVSIEHHELMKSIKVKYWLSIFNSSKIHGREDGCFENAIGKLLEFGFSNDNKILDDLLKPFVSDEFWNSIDFMGWGSFKVVLYPFLIRAGYHDNKAIDSFFHDRVCKLERTIDKYSYDFEAINKQCSAKYQDEFIFKINSREEALPTIYDIYAFAFYPRANNEIHERIERIIEYILDERFQRIPGKAYLYDEARKRYYAAGNVFHACLIDQRKLLSVYLLSHFKVASTNDIFHSALQELRLCKSDNGFYEFDESLLKEKKNSYHLYSGGHMGLGENRRSSKWRKIESTYWMLKILYNLEVNNPQRE